MLFRKSTNDSSTVDSSQKKKDIKAVLLEALIVGVSAALALVGNELSGLDLGPYTALIVPGLAVAISTVQKWIAANRKQNESEENLDD